jgi:hypothetical protein
MVKGQTITYSQQTLDGLGNSITEGWTGTYDGEDEKVENVAVFERR